jgi:heme exporter protein D
MVWLTAHLAVLSPGLLLGQADKLFEGGEMTAALAPAGRQPNFQPYIFWAYGLACVTILLFTLWTLWQNRQIQGRLDALEERFRQARPEGNENSAV